MKSTLVGCGAIAPTYLGYLRSIPDVTVVALCDARTERAQELGERYGISRRFEKLEEMLHETRPDVVHILTPPAIAPDLAIEALRHGAHVLVEKPMASNIADAQRMMQAIKEGNGRLGIDHSRLLHPSVLRARDRLQSGSLGDLVSSEVVQGYDPSTATPMDRSGSPRWALSYPWGILENLLPHSIYLCLAFSGAPTDIRVQAVDGGRAKPSPFDDLRVLWKGEQAVGQITLTLAGAPERNTVTLRGTKATLTVDTNQVSEILHRDSSLPRMVAKAAVSLDLAGQNLGVTIRNTWGYVRGSLRAYPEIEATLRAFYAALRTGNPLPTEARDGLLVVELMDRIRAEAAAQIGYSE
jgi:predicted dehydrogenase